MKKKITNLNTIKISKEDTYLIKYLISGFLFFFLIEFFLRINLIMLSSYSDIMFSQSAIEFLLLYSFIILTILLIIPKKYSKIISLIINISSIILFIINYMVIKIKKVPLSISLIRFTKEATKYKDFVIKEINIKLIIMIFALIICSYINIINLQKIKETMFSKRKKLKIYGYLALIIIGIYIGCLESLYHNNSKMCYINAKYYYDNHNVYPDSAVSLGIYEYTYRDIYFSLKKDSLNKIQQKNIEDLQIKKEDNEYTGIFKDKNLIMIMLESMDNRILSEENTPTIMKLKENGWDFSKRYSYIPLGGVTLYTEFTSLTGLLFNNSYYDKIHSNIYNDSLPNMFNNNGYKTISMHENESTFYRRNILHKKYLFNESYFLMDISDNVIPYTDAQMVDNDDFYNKLVPKNEDKFMSYVITISAHGPYDRTNEECIDSNTEIDCFKKLAKRTDVFIEHLINRLKEDNLVDDTVILLYTDHHSYLYHYEKEYLDTLNKIDNYKNIMSIPFIIYDSSIKPQKFDNILVNDIDLLPTILNLFDIEYDPNNYIGRDIFSSSHKNILLFDDYSWYDGIKYSPNVNKSNYKNYEENENYSQIIHELNDYYLSNKYQ